MLCICCHSHGLFVCVFLIFCDYMHITFCSCGCTSVASMLRPRLSCFVVVLLLLHVSLFYCGGFVWVIVFMCCNVGLRCCTLGAFVFAHVFMMVGSFLYLDLMIRICCHFYGTLCLLCVILSFWYFVYNGLFLLSNFFVI